MIKENIVKILMLMAIFVVVLGGLYVSGYSIPFLDFNSSPDKQQTK